MALLTDLEKVRRRRARQRMIRNLLLLTVFAGVVFFSIALIRQVGNLDMKTAISDITAEIATGGGYPVALPGGRVVSLDATSDSLVLMTDTNLYTYNSSGKQMLSAQHGMVKPALSTARDRVLVYDRGGMRLNLYSRSADVGTQTTPNIVYTGDVAGNGNYAVVTGSNEAIARVVVYNRSNKEIFRFSSGDKPVIGVSLADSREEMVVARVDVSNGSYVSEISKYQFSYQESDIGKVDLPGELVLSVNYLSSNNVRVITDKRAVLLDSNLRELRSVSYGDQPLDRFLDCPGGKLLLVLGDYETDKQVTIFAYDADFRELGRFTEKLEVVDLKADADTIYAAGKSSLEVLSYDGKRLNQTQINNLQAVQPIGGTLYFVTNTMISTMDIKTLIAPPEEAEKDASSGKASPGAAGSVPASSSKGTSGSSEADSHPQDGEAEASSDSSGEEAELSENLIATPETSAAPSEPEDMPEGSTSELRQPPEPTA